MSAIMPIVEVQVTLSEPHALAMREPFPATLDGLEPDYIEELKKHECLVMHGGVWCWNPKELTS